MKPYATAAGSHYDLPKDTSQPSRDKLENAGFQAAPNSKTKKTEELSKLMGLAELH